MIQPQSLFWICVLLELPQSLTTNLRRTQEISRRSQGIELSSHVSEYGIVEDSFVAKLCAGRANSELDNIMDYIESKNSERSLWKANVRYEIRQIKYSRFMLCLENVTSVALRDLLTIKDICDISENGVVVTSAYSWGLDRMDQPSLPLDLSPLQTTLKGSGVDIYILDTGVDTLHSEFISGFSGLERDVLNIWDGYNSAEAQGCDPSCPGLGGSFNNDYNGHGSHCAGIIGGKTSGAASGSSLFGLKVLGDNGLGSFSVMIKAIDYVMTRVGERDRPSILSMSINGGFYKPVNDMINSAVSSGITVVVAAGNGASDACSYSPSSAAEAITVGATTNDDRVSSFSNHGSCVTIYAPGSRIVSVKTGSGHEYASFSGTSMACPHVAASAALMLQARPDMTPAQVKSSLLCQSKPHRLFDVEGNEWEDTASRYLAQLPLSSQFDVSETFSEDVCFQEKPSDANCQSLGWTNAERYGSAEVCGESDLNLGGCSGEISWSYADSFCSNVGARLCTLAELQNDEARGTGCQYDSQLVWSSTACDRDGHYVTKGSSSSVGGSFECGAPDAAYVARCCADTAPPTSAPSVAPTAQPTLLPSKYILNCDDLGWTNAERYGSAEVCGESDKGVLGGCSGEISWSYADSFCSNVGARLCTLSELQNDEARGTGCQLDSQLVWSSTECDNGNGHFLARGGSTFGDDTRCGLLDSEHSARCCADVGQAPSPVPTPLPSTQPSSSPTRFDMSCGDLGWTNAERYGSAEVCGESDLNLGGCSGEVSWSQGVAFCESVGARLCSLQDLLNDEARSTGCGLDSQYIWSDIDCGDGGHFLALGSSSFGSEIRCGAFSEAHPVRCCARVFIPPTAPTSFPTQLPTSSVPKASCGDLGWTNAERYGSAEVCGESDKGVLGGCSGEISWSYADSFCSNVGARLCTLSELQNDEARGTGCQLDSQLVWSSTECDNGNGHFLARGGSTFGDDTRCGLLDSEHSARCCADVGQAPSPVPIPLPSTQPSSSPTRFDMSCGDLGWTNAERYGSAEVCGESDLNLGGCSGEVSWSSADSFCSNVGARLCTLAELQNDEARGTGCQLDSQLVWSSTECDNGNGHFLARGGSTFGDDTSCSLLDSEHSARCCADVGPSNSGGADSSSGSIPCEYLDWTNAERYGSAEVCGESDLNLGGCSGEISWSYADSFCSNVGARLCTLAELQNDEARGTGCQLDSQLVWSSTECDNGHIIGIGSTRFDSNPRCVSDSDLRSARCCANTIQELLPTAVPTHVPLGGGSGNVDDDLRHPMTPTITPGGSGATGDFVPRTCQELGWTNAETYGSAEVCGESDSSLGGCSGEISWSSAHSFCSKVGARLCTLAELQNDEASGTGCQYDLAYVWSSNGCNSGNSHMIGFGSNNGMPAVCEQDFSLRFARCCASTHYPESLVP